MSEYVQYRRNVPLLYALAFLSGFQLYGPVLILFLQGRLGSVFAVTVILAIQLCIQSVVEVPSGAFADKFGRRRTLILAEVVWLASIIALIVTNSIAGVVMWTILCALGASLASGTDTALLYDSIKAEKKQDDRKARHSMGIHTGLWPLGASVSALIGGIIASHSIPATISYSLIPAGLGLLCALMLSEVPYPPSKHTHVWAHMAAASKSVRKERALLWLLLLGLCLNVFGEMAHQLKQPFFLERGIPIIAFGILYCVSNGLSFFGSLISERLTSHLGDKRTLIVCILAGAVLGGIALLTTGWLLGALLVSASLFWGIQWPIVTHRLNDRTESSERATVNSVLNFTKNVGLAIVLPISGLIADSLGLTALFIIAAALQLVSLIPLVFVFRYQLPLE